MCTLRLWPALCCADIVMSVLEKRSWKSLQFWFFLLIQFGKLLSITERQQTGSKCAPEMSSFKGQGPQRLWSLGRRREWGRRVGFLPEMQEQSWLGFPWKKTHSTRVCQIHSGTEMANLWEKQGGSFLLHGAGEDHFSWYALGSHRCAFPDQLFPFCTEFLWEGKYSLFREPWKMLAKILSGEVSKAAG